MSGVRAGDVIAGKFRVERVLGEGGMGYVVAARHLQLGQMVALKFMRDEVCTPEYKARFLREARNTVRLKSKHVSRVLDVGSLDGGSPYMVMEYLEGTDLSELLHQRGAFPVQEACDYVIQACEAIAEAHANGIIHRDLKPANLFLTRGSGGEPVVKVLDFGVSKMLDLGLDDDTSPGGRPRRHHADSVVTKATDLLGSPSYMAPEQIASARDADLRSDVWSLGVILFRLVSGKAPFAGSSLGELIQSIMHGPIPNLREARPDVPPGLEHVVARCLERERERRLGDVVELARMLAPYAGPVATPSLERIAILGPALISAPPSRPRHATNPSVSNGRSAWTSAPIVAAVDAPPQTPPWLTNLLWGGLFLLVVGAAYLAVVKMTTPRGAADRAAASPPPVVSLVPVAPPPTMQAATSGAVPPPPPTGEAAPVVAARPVAPATASARPRPRPTAAATETAPPAPTQDIPATRE